MGNENMARGVMVLCEYTEHGIHRVAYELLNKGKETLYYLNIWENNQ